MECANLHREYTLLRGIIKTIHSSSGVTAKGWQRDPAYYRRAILDIVTNTYLTGAPAASERAAEEQFLQRMLGDAIVELRNEARRLRAENHEFRRRLHALGLSTKGKADE